METNHEKESSALQENDSAKVLTREKLYSLVWAEPMLKVAACLGVSSSYMARVCSRMNVPRPALGYWEKFYAGKILKKPALPEARPGDELVWAKGGNVPSIPRPLPRPPKIIPRKITNKAQAKQDNHPLIVGAKGLFEAGRLSDNAGYLKPAKKLLVDLTVTKTGLDRALDLANRLFLSLEESGYRVIIAPQSEMHYRHRTDEREKPTRTHHYDNLWSPIRITVAYIGTVPIGLTILEMSEEVEARYVNGTYIRESEYVPQKRRSYGFSEGWKTTKSFSSGRLCLHAYCPHPRAKWTHQWRETKGQEIVANIPKIIKELERSAVDVAHMIEEGEREAELERQKWEEQLAKLKREEIERRLAKAMKESTEELVQIVNDWTQAMYFERFFQDLEQKMDMAEGDHKFKMMEKINRARELIANKNSLEELMKWRAPEDR